MSEEGRTPPAALYKSMVEFSAPLSDGAVCILTDYASAGKQWTDESKMAAWIKVR